VKDRLSNLLHPDAEIAPLFSVELQRAAYSLTHPDHPRGLVEMAFDDARVRARDSIDFKELALELKNGSHELLASILAAVELEPAFIDARLSKYERGLIAARLPLERRRSLKPSTLGRHSRWLDVAVAHLKAQLHQIKLYEPYAWEAVHVEGVHQMRVATRRARAALHTFAPVMPAAEANHLAPRLRWLATALGCMRDLDVHLAHLAAYRKHLKPSEQSTLMHYQAHLSQLHETAHRDLISALTHDDYAELISDFQALLTAAVRPENASSLRVDEVAHKSVTPLLDRVHRRGRDINGNSSDKHLHRLRIDVKRLRYQLEFLEGPYLGALDPVVSALRKLQGRLGLHQDACVARAHLARYRKLHAIDKWERSIFKQLIRLEKNRAQQQRQRFAGNWQQFEQASADLPQRL
jgi:CHAD domain-containing protein